MCIPNCAESMHMGEEVLCRTLPAQDFLVQTSSDYNHRRPVVQAGPLYRQGCGPVQKTACKTSPFTCASTCMGMSVLEMLLRPLHVLRTSSEEPLPGASLIFFGQTNGMEN